MSIKQLSKKELRESKLSRTAFGDLPRNPFYIILDNLKDMKNVGAILRLADATLAEKVFICENYSVIPPNRKITVSSGGSEKWVNWEYQPRTLDVISNLKQQNIQIVALEIANTSVHYLKADYSTPLALIVGREDDGISSEVLEVADMIVHLPILGMCNSLNVATTAGVMLYHLLDKIK